MVGSRARRRDVSRRRALRALDPIASDVRASCPSSPNRPPSRLAESVSPRPLQLSAPPPHAEQLRRQDERTAAGAICGCVSEPCDGPGPSDTFPTGPGYAYATGWPVTVKDTGV